MTTLEIEGLKTEIERVDDIPLIYGMLEQMDLCARTIRVYGLEAKRLRIDATVGSVSHDPEQHTLFQVGKAKNGLYETQFKLSLASLDPLGLPIVCDMEAGNRARLQLY